LELAAAGEYTKVRSAVEIMFDLRRSGDAVGTMPLNIRSQETEELAKTLARLTGETKTEAVTQALRERIQRIRGARAKRRLADELDEIALHCSTLPVRDPHSPDEVMGYDENGLPR
jgi:antitoxin VapB